jgi:cyanophycinase
MKRKGYLALIGGAEDKTHNKSVLRQVVELNRARNAAIIPTASSYGTDLGAEYAAIFRGFGVSQCSVLDILHPEQARDPRHLAAVVSADLIFFTGGDQVRLVQVFDNSPLLALVRERLAAGATVAGTSAGAAAVSNPMIYDGDGQGFEKGSVRMTKGFGFLDGVTIDTHFVARGRIARLTQFLCTGHSEYGLGLSEDTGLIIAPDDIATVFGSDVVTALSHRNVEYSNYHDVEHEQRYTVHGVQLSFLAPGAKFDLHSWSCIDSKGRPSSGKNVNRPRAAAIE